MYKLIAIDVDGTILNNNKKISDETIEAIKYAKSKNVKIVLCTGRPFIGIENFLNILSLNKEDDYCITSNGAVIQNCHNKKIISHFSLGIDDLKSIHHFTLEENLSMHFLDNENMYTLNKNINRWTIHDAYNCKSSINCLDIDNIDKNFIFDKIIITDNTCLIDTVFPKIINTFEKKYRIFRSSKSFVEIINKHTDKSVGLEILSNFLNISKENIIAIGDNENDISMIQFAGLGVSMDNAISSLKKYSNYITSSNDENGVAKVIKKFI